MNICNLTNLIKNATAPEHTFSKNQAMMCWSGGPVLKVLGKLDIVHHAVHVYRHSGDLGSVTEQLYMTVRCR